MWCPAPQKRVTNISPVVYQREQYARTYIVTSQTRPGKSRSSRCHRANCFHADGSKSAGGRSCPDGCTPCVWQAQGSRVAAALEGSVKDSSGAAIAGAAVAVRNASTNQSRGMKTNEEGGFRAEALPVGTYEIPVNLSGFAPYRQAGFDLTLGETARLDIVLFPASLSEQVSVNAEQQAFDLSQASVVSPVDRERIEELPVQTRNSIENGLAALAEIVSSRIRANSRYCSVAYFPRIRIFQRFSHLLASRYT